MKKPTKKSLTRKLDLVCSLIIRKRMECAWCTIKVQSVSDLQCAHIFSRSYRNTRWDLQNLLSLCPSCHFYGHRNPIAFAEFVKSLMSDYEYTQLKIKHVSIKRWTIIDMQDLHNSLTKELDNANGNLR